jgi:hypothetical protein
MYKNNFGYKTRVLLLNVIVISINKSSPLCISQSKIYEKFTPSELFLLASNGLHFTLSRSRVRL